MFFELQSFGASLVKLKNTATGRFLTMKKNGSLRGQVRYSLTIETLSTGTFLHDGALFSVSRLDRERRFGTNFLLKQRAYHNDRRTQGREN